MGKLKKILIKENETLYGVKLIEKVKKKKEKNFKE
jgi:hypothetical protein